MDIVNRLKSIIARPKKEAPESSKRATNGASIRTSSYAQSKSRSSARRDNVLPPVSVKSSYRILRNLRVPKDQLSPVSVTVYCPYRPATIYCHSFLIDKLGDLTKFIIQALYTGQPIEKIKDLTQLGDKAIEEELAYLVRGQLIVSMEDVRLTELGEQYGLLLERFSLLSDGIPVVLNTFANQFEESTVLFDLPESTSEDGITLNESFSLVLTRNDDHLNSLDIAKKHVTADIPFKHEILNSLYTTVRVSSEKDIRYRKLQIKQFDRGYSQASDHSVPILIPFDRVVFRPLYKKLDRYRDILPSLINLSTTSGELLTEDAQSLASLALEETEADDIIAVIDLITGDVSSDDSSLLKEVTDDGIFTLSGSAVSVCASDAIPDSIYIKETQREHFYKIRYYPYSVMEEEE